jgi:hypothetical protein
MGAFAFVCVAALVPNAAGAVRSPTVRADLAYLGPHSVYYDGLC